MKGGFAGMSDTAERTRENGFLTQRFFCAPHLVPDEEVPSKNIFRSIWFQFDDSNAKRSADPYIRLLYSELCKRIPPLCHYAIVVNMPCQIILLLNYSEHFEQDILMAAKEINRKHQSAAFMASGSTVTMTIGGGMEASFSDIFFSASG